MDVIRQKQPCAVCDGVPSDYVEMISGHVRQRASRLGVPKRNSFWATVVTPFEHYWSPSPRERCGQFDVHGGSAASEPVTDFSRENTRERRYTLPERRTCSAYLDAHA